MRQDVARTWRPELVTILLTAAVRRSSRNANDGTISGLEAKQSAGLTAAGPLVRLPADRDLKIEDLRGWVNLLLHDHEHHIF